MTWNWAGSRWWRVDLHVHTPASHDYRPKSGEASADWDGWLRAAAEAGLHAVVISDHNTERAIDAIKAARASAPNRPVVFPGVEVTASDNTHLVFVLDQVCRAEHVGEILTSAGIPVDVRGFDSASSPRSVADLLTLGHERGIVVISAHANKRRGVLELDGLARIKALTSTGLMAVDIVPDQPYDQSWIDGSKPEIGRVIPVVHGSDAHATDEIGRRFTWVKMTAPTLDGLRLALLDGQDSLRPATQDSSDDPNRHASFAIESITVESAKHMGGEQPFEVAFNPWLNAIIGPRGTGKSTLVDLARLVLRRQEDLGEATEGSIGQAFVRRMRVPASRQDEGLLKPDTLVSLVYRKDGQRYRLAWDVAGTAQPITHLDGGGETVEGGDIRERFPVRIYSQKQLFDLAQNPSALLDVIDGSADVRGSELARQMQEAETRFFALRAQARALRSQSASLPDRVAELADARRKVDVLSAGTEAATFARYAIRQRQDRDWHLVRGATVDGIEAIQEAAEAAAVPDLDLRAESDSPGPASQLVEAHRRLGDTLAALRSEVASAVQRARGEITQIDQGPELQAWRAEVTDASQAYETAALRLEAEGITDPQEYRELIRRSAALEGEIAKLRSLGVEAEAREREAVAELERYRTLGTTLNERREAFCASQTSDTLSMHVELERHDRLVASLATSLREILGLERFERDIESIARSVAGKNGEGWSYARVDAEADRLEAAARNDWQGSWQDRRFGPALERVAPQSIDRIRLLRSTETVAVKRRDGGGWQPLALGSPGQQTAALLAFVVGFGDEPIVLDQPEDDLDSTLIYDLVVRLLRDSKSRRQVIVVTHNANIVVHGDAELVIVFESRDDQALVAFAGGLQESQARSEICRVLEGGERAFRVRYRRIMEGSDGA